MFQRILVPTDGSPGSRNAAHAAIELAKVTGGSIITVHVVPPVIPEMMMDGMGGMGEMVVPVPVEAHLGATADRDPVENDPALMDVESQARKAGVRVTSEQVADFGAADAIMDFATARQCDLIVMGAARYNALVALVRGSTAQRVAAGSNVPVLLVH